VLDQQFHLINRWKTKKLKRLTKREKELMIWTLKKQLDEYIATWEFEKAAFIRDQLKELQED
jgi:protein-arginine kinase activator protein McsA